ncbi:hypothetical protein AB0M97_08570 [Streptomyces sp. NPDC051207]|uniref:hypothetical protein n=1 Tax=Streptomyces sp. NPDC051207 TaxID=3154641 RepID=UPI00342B97D2
MYGHGAAPPTRSAATVITLRVLYAAAGVLTCGLFACVPLFRIALLRGRWYQWAAAWLSLPVCIACLMVVGALPEGDSRADVALAVVLLVGAAGTAWFLTVDIRFHNEQRRGAGYAPSQAPTVHSGYGYPQTGSPYAPTPVPRSTPTPTPMPPVRPPAPHGAVPPVPPPGGPLPGPARIDQVRAELDELSDYLRRQDGTQQDGR